jgi:hypothetical protein
MRVAVAVAVAVAQANYLAPFLILLFFCDEPYSKKMCALTAANPLQ